MAESLARRALLPPSPGAAPTPERVRLIAWARLITGGFATIGNVCVFALLRNAEGVREQAVVVGAITNVSLLVVDLILTSLFLFRRGRAYAPVFAICLTCEVAAGLLWLQLTGTVSSYYIGAGLLITLLYRLSVGYRAGLFFGAATLAGHVGLFLLEEAGVLQAASLFVEEPSGLYGSSTFRWAAMSSMTWLYGIAFASGNFAATLLSEKDVAVDAAERKAHDAVEQIRPGRLSGKRLAGRWQLGEVLGRGGMGEVYQGTSVADGRPIAVKIMHAHLDASHDARERFRREASMVARVPGGHVPALHDVGISEDGLDYLVMDLVRGEDVGAMLRRRGVLPPDDVVTLVTRVAAALDSCHEVGVVHRDLKPSNLLLVDGRLDDVRLVDFGLARLYEATPGDDAPLTRAEMILGTAGYLAPEQVRPSIGAVGPATDVLALGAIAYRGLTGVAAFPAREVAAAIDQALYLYPRAPSSLVPSLPRDVDLVVALALAKVPSVRYARAGDFALDLAAALAGTLSQEVRDRAARVALPTGEPASVVSPTMATAELR